MLSIDSSPEFETDEKRVNEMMKQVSHDVTFILHELTL